MILTAVIDAKEGWDVAVTDIPGTYLHTEMEEDVWILLDETLAEIMEKASQQRFLNIRR